MLHEGDDEDNIEYDSPRVEEIIRFDEQEDNQVNQDENEAGDLKSSIANH